MSRSELKEFLARNGAKGGKAKAARMTAAQRSAWGKKAAAARWRKAK